MITVLSKKYEWFPVFIGCPCSSLLQEINLFIILQQYGYGFWKDHGLG